MLLKRKEWLYDSKTNKMYDGKTYYVDSESSVYAWNKANNDCINVNLLYQYLDIDDQNYLDKEIDYLRIISASYNKLLTINNKIYEGFYSDRLDIYICRPVIRVVPYFDYKRRFKLWQF